MPEASIYLDYNSTTPVDPRVVEAMTGAWRDCSANPASQHAAGRRARRMLEDAREGVAEGLGARTGGMDADQVVFTSGGTEANNLVLFGLASHWPAVPENAVGDQTSFSARAKRPAIIVSAIEHSSIVEATEELQRRGYRIVTLPVTSDGVVDGSPLERLESEVQPLLATTMLANNETGVLQPVERIAQLCRARDIVVHTDAAQAIGKVRVHFRELGVDALSVAPHKFHGPLGIGALVLRHGRTLRPLMFGGFQQSGMRPGTENVALAVGLCEAIRLATHELAQRAARMQVLRDELERKLREAFPDIVVVGQRALRLPHTANIAFPGVDRQALIMALDLAGVACSTGSTCASGSSEPSRTLAAMGLSEDVLHAAIRLSLGAFTTASEIDEGSRRIIMVVKHLKASK